MEKTKIIALAKQAGLIYNEELLQSEIYPHHRKAIYEFVRLIEQEIQELKDKSKDKSKENTENR